MDCKCKCHRNRACHKCYESACSLYNAEKGNVNTVQERKTLPIVQKINDFIKELRENPEASKEFGKLIATATAFILIIYAVIQVFNK